MRRPAGLALLALLATLSLVPGARAAGMAGTATALDREMDRAGAASGALVVDLSQDRTIYAARAGTPRIPASVNKLATTASALMAFGPDATLRTEVLAVAPPDALGVVTGDVWLRGAGDPTFDAAEAARLARDVADAGVRRITGTVRADESLFDRLRGPHSLRASAWVAPLSALGFARPSTADPARAAATTFAAALRREGVRGARRTATGVAPAEAQPVGGWTSPTMARLAALANVPSDNYVAEMLLKGLGASFGAGGTTPSGAAVVRGTLAEIGARATVVDGSGLSRANRVAPRAVVALLEHVVSSPMFPAFEASLPIAGRTGTLAKRLRGTLAQDNCRAKTGSLIGVSALAGYCTSRRGARVAFAFLMNGINVTWARRLQDRMVATLARYDGPPAAQVLVDAPSGTGGAAAGVR